MLSSNDQFTVTGQLWQQGGKQRKQRGAAAGSAEAAEAWRKPWSFRVPGRYIVDIITP